MSIMLTIQLTLTDPFIQQCNQMLRRQKTATI